MNTFEEKTQWPLIWSLISINVAIIISWMAYHNYQPVLLERFELNYLGTFLAWAKLFVLLLIPPLSGWMADRMKESNKSSIPLLTSGIGITALVFMVVASLITPEPLFPLTEFLPLMILIWLVSMNLFYAPALATLERFVPVEKLTMVMGVYILISDIVYGLEPAIVLLVNFVGASLTFVVGAVLIGASGLWFHFNLKKYKPKLVIVESNPAESKFSKVLLIGLAFGIIFGFLINVFPLLFVSQQKILHFGEYTGEILVSGMFIMTAIAAYGLSTHLSYLENPKLFDYAFILGLLLIFGSFIINGDTFFVIAMLFIPVLAVLSIMAFPLAIANVPNKHKMLGAGLFLAGLELPDSILELLI